MPTSTTRTKAGTGRRASGGVAVTFALRSRIPVSGTHPTIEQDASSAGGGLLMRVTVVEGPPADRGRRVAYDLTDISEATAHSPRRPRRAPVPAAPESEVLVGLRYRLEDVRAGAGSVVLEAGRGGFEHHAQDHHSPCALPTPIAGPIVRDGGPPFVARCLACGGSSAPYRRKNAPTLWRWAHNHRCVDAATLQALFERSGRATTKKTARTAKKSPAQA